MSKQSIDQNFLFGKVPGNGIWTIHLSEPEKNLYLAKINLLLPTSPLKDKNYECPYLAGQFIGPKPPVIFGEELRATWGQFPIDTNIKAPTDTMVEFMSLIKNNNFRYRRQSIQTSSKFTAIEGAIRYLEIAALDILHTIKINIDSLKLMVDSVNINEPQSDKITVKIPKILQ